MSKRKLVMDKAKERIRKISDGVSGAQNKAQLLQKKLELLATTVQDAKDLCADMAELMDQLNDLETLAHPTNWRVQARADGVNLPNE